MTERQSDTSVTSKRVKPAKLTIQNLKHYNKLSESAFKKPPDVDSDRESIVRSAYGASSSASDKNNDRTSKSEREYKLTKRRAKTDLLKSQTSKSVSSVRKIKSTKNTAVDKPIKLVDKDIKHKTKRSPHSSKERPPTISAILVADSEESELSSPESTMTEQSEKLRDPALHQHHPTELQDEASALPAPTSDPASGEQSTHHYSTPTDDMTSFVSLYSLPTTSDTLIPSAAAAGQKTLLERFNESEAVIAQLQQQILLFQAEKALWSIANQPKNLQPPPPAAHDRDTSRPGSDADGGRHDAPRRAQAKKRRGDIPQRGRPEEPPTTLLAGEAPCQIHCHFYTQPGSAGP